MTDESGDPRWLDDAQQRAWRSLLAVTLLLPARLDAQLRRDAGLTHFEYWTLVRLSEAPQRSARMTTLAHWSAASPSRVSHVVARLEARGLVVREPDGDDRRASRARLTPDGYATLVDAAPGHVETARALVIDGLSARDTAALERICASIQQRLEATGDASG